MSRWTRRQWLGFYKFTNDWLTLWPEWIPFLGNKHGFGLIVDGAGHLAIGMVAAVPAILLGASYWTMPAFAAVIGTGREVWQVLSDSSPNPNLMDRIVDVAQITLGGALIGLFFS